MMSDVVPPRRRHAWIDATAGVAGDMLLGALIDAGADLAAVQRAIDLVIPGSVRLDRNQVTRAGQRATKIDVVVLVDDPPHRTWHTIRALLTTSDLAAQIRDRALAVFARLAAAEAHVHGITASDVHFHEVGALDSFADVVGVCAALAELGVDTVSGSEVAVGSGRVPTAHGELPVPVPAVVELSRGWQVSAGGRGELATPTGMALIATMASVCEPFPSLLVDTVGVGAGSKDTAGRPNVTRIVLGEPAPAGEQGAAELALLLEANVDDLDPRLWPGVLQMLVEAGAADAWLVPILMKKGRPAHTLSVLCRPSQSGMIRNLIYANTSTIGVREQTFRRHALPRVWRDVEVAGDTVAVKLAHRDGVIVTATPEFDTVTEVAARQSRSPRIVLSDAIAAAAAAGLVTGAPVPIDTRPLE